MRKAICCDRRFGIRCCARRRIRRTPLRRPPAYPSLRHPAIAAPTIPLRDHGAAMSTRYLIIIALITGLVILAASAIQFMMAG